MVLLVGAVSLVCAWLASQLELRTRYDQLLPDSQPSVIEMRRVAAKTNGSQAVMVVLEGADSVTLRAFGDALVPKLTALGPDVVSHAEDGIQSSRTFLRPRAGLFASRDDLEKLAVDLDARWDWEVSQATGSDLEQVVGCIVWRGWQVGGDANLIVVRRQIGHGPQEATATEPGERSMNAPERVHKPRRREFRRSGCRCVHG